MKKYPLLFAVLSLFLGGVIAFLGMMPITFWLVGAITSIGMILFLFSMFPHFWNKRFNRILISGMTFLMLGGLHFSLNDFRMNPSEIQLDTDQQTLVARVIEVKKTTALRQTVLLAIEKEKVQHELLEKEGRLLLTYEFLNQHTLLKVDDQVALCVKLNPIRNKNNPGEFDAAYYYRSKRIQAGAYANAGQLIVLGNHLSWNGIFTKWRNQLASLMDEHLDGVFLGISKALILGDKSNLEQEDVDAFTNTGSMHVLAVSGLHIGLLLMMISKVLELFSKWISKRNALIVSLILIWIYGLISGASPSVMRAVIMFSIIAAAQLFHRKNSAVNGLMLSAIVLFMLDPWVFFDIGFQLTYAAMIGIFFLYEPIRDLVFFEQKLLRITWEGTAVGIAATILTTPLTLYWFYQFPNYFALANLGVMVFGFLVLLGGMLFLFTSWIPGIGALVAFLFSLTIIGLVKWVGLIDSIPGAVSGGFQLSLLELFVALMIVVSWVIFLKSPRHVKGVLVCCSIVFVANLSCNRLHLFQSEQLIVMKSNQFILVLKSPKGNIALYEPKLSIIEKVPQELKAFERFSGTTFDKYVLTSSMMQVKLGKDVLFIEKQKEGWGFHWKKKKYFYRQKGIPQPQEDQRLMSVKMQNYLNPEATHEPFVLNY